MAPSPGIALREAFEVEMLCAPLSFESLDTPNSCTRASAVFTTTPEHKSSRHPDLDPCLDGLNAGLGNHNLVFTTRSKRYHVSGANYVYLKVRRNPKTAKTVEGNLTNRLQKNVNFRNPAATNSEKWPQVRELLSEKLSKSKCSARH